MADFYEHSTASRALVDNSFSDNKELDKAYNDVRFIEPLISEKVWNAVDSLGNELIGTQFAMKTASSVNDKLERVQQKMQDSELDINLPEVFSQIKDLIRYTEICPHDDIMKVAEATIKKLEEDGFTLSGYKNYFLKPYPQTGYKGLHLNFISPYGQEIELQVHSKESFETKQNGHDLYEKVRAVATQEEDKKALIAEMVALHRKTPNPAGYDRFCPNQERTNGKIRAEWTMSADEKDRIREQNSSRVQIYSSEYAFHSNDRNRTMVFDIYFDGKECLNGFNNIYSDGSAQAYQNYTDKGRAKIMSVDKAGHEILTKETQQRTFTLGKAVYLAGVAERTNQIYDNRFANADFEKYRGLAEAIIRCNSERNRTIDNLKSHSHNRE